MQKSWQASELGDAQLHELNSMIRAQDSYLGAPFALFLVANAVLVFSFYQQEGHYLARSAISLVALALNGSLLLVLLDARNNLRLWTEKALALESDLGVAQQFRIWGETPKGIPKWKTGLLMAAALLVYWGVCLAFAAANLLL
ncbi:MAG: hypothetical protein JW880_00370 [Candidatus Thermoplasmatota archaeon]|nr:hypothetical protein [Candidatus Thermoplasmatota archaeon]